MQATRLLLHDRNDRRCPFDPLRAGRLPYNLRCRVHFAAQMGDFLVWQAEFLVPAIEFLAPENELLVWQTGFLAPENESLVWLAPPPAR